MNHKKAIKAPIITAQKAARSILLETKAITEKAPKAVIKIPPDNPSRPSVMLTALAVETITRINRGM